MKNGDIRADFPSATSGWLKRRNLLDEHTVGQILLWCHHKEFAWSYTRDEFGLVPLSTLHGQLIQQPCSPAEGGRGLILDHSTQQGMCHRLHQEQAFHEGKERMLTENTVVAEESLWKEFPEALSISLTLLPLVSGKTPLYFHQSRVRLMQHAFRKAALYAQASE